jgi:hypothetical protein
MIANDTFGVLVAQRTSLGVLFCDLFAMHRLKRLIRDVPPPTSTETRAAFGDCV